MAENDSPRARLCLSSPAIYNEDQLQVGESATGQIKGTENRSWEGHRCSKEAGEGCWLSNSHSSTTIRAQANPLWLGLLPGANYDHPWKTSRGVEVSLAPGHRARKGTFFLAWKPQVPLFSFSLSAQEGGGKNLDQVLGSVLSKGSSTVGAENRGAGGGQPFFPSLRLAALRGFPWGGEPIITWITGWRWEG